MLSHPAAPALCCRKEAYSSASSDCSMDSTKSLSQDVQSRTFAGWGWWASATGGHPQLVGIRNWRASASGGHPQPVVIRNWWASATGERQRQSRSRGAPGMERGWVVLAGSIHGTAVSLWERAAGRGPVLNDEDQGQAVRKGAPFPKRGTERRVGGSLKLGR
eukprot:scaffold4082_cov62-Phaeocystis_antarctica.AAC.11